MKSCFFRIISFSLNYGQRVSKSKEVKIRDHAAGVTYEVSGELGCECFMEKTGFKDATASKKEPLQRDPISLPDQLIIVCRISSRQLTQARAARKLGLAVDPGNPAYWNLFMQLEERNNVSFDEKINYISYMGLYLKKIYVE